MNFNLYMNLGVFKKGSQFLVQGRRVFMGRKGKITIYPMETFLITSDEERAWKKHTLLQNCTAKI